MKPKNQNFISKNFNTSLKDLKNIKSYFWFSFFLFFFIALIGLIFPIFFEDKILSIIRELIKKTEGLGVFELTQFIILNNMQSAFISMFFGVFLGIFPIGVLVINSYILGFVANKSIAVGGILILWRLIPHGILEIPAILISLAIGLKIGLSLMYNCIKHYERNISNITLVFLIFISILFFPVSFPIYMIITLMNKNLKEKFFENLIMASRVFIFIIIPLLVIAGIIEGSLIFLLN